MDQVRIHRFLEKTKKKRAKREEHQEDESNDMAKKQENLRKMVTDLIKKQKLPAVKKIVKGHDDSKPWSPDTKAKVNHWDS